MNVPLILGCLAVGVVAAIGFDAAIRAHVSWKVGRAVRRSSSAGAKLDPESRFVVRIGDSEVVCDRPDGTQERVRWDELERVEIVSTSKGPRVPDIFWLLVGDVGGCAIPWGAMGEAALLERLQALPGFDNGAVIQASSDATDARRLCWQRSS